MAIPPWTVELLRRGLQDVARRASEPETIERLKTQATEFMNDLPQTAARGLDAVVRATETGRKSVQRWSKKQTAVTIPLINASGTLLTPYGTGVSVATDAVEAAYACLHGDIRSDGRAITRLENHLQRQLPFGDEMRIAVTNHFQAALLAFVIGMSQEDIVVHRSQSIRLANGVSLVDAMNALVPMVQEVGANDEIEMSDFNDFDSFCFVMAENESSDAAAPPLDFGNRDVTQVAVLPVATLKPSTLPSLPSVEQVLKQGADLVIVQGGGTFGGPDCGILIGKRELVDAITHTSIWPSLAANNATMAMLSTTIAEMASAIALKLPIEELMRTSEENLRTRGERLAMRMSGSDSIKSCQLTADEARITKKGRWKLPSRQVRIEHESMTGEQWANRLREEMPSLLVDFDEQAIRIDLRWVDPAQDKQIGELLGAEQETAVVPNDGGDSTSE
ncbi:L-seryl-tRNA(Sec) selenium transferase [Novipirellula aureliae]|uniref:L-seryl-tRNA(Sec) selenium transferase n=1 Tax=Novipirellula aureliae TaxID=2527966 RepID=A0A5C6E3L5_9BACT|nr:hypothetical protein [Novipirellula aureliae]TWU43074.1 L-seryl-tRNA(Sec) selenium transferase [Novipirellula aureliae]